MAPTALLKGDPLRRRFREDALWALPVVALCAITGAAAGAAPLLVLALAAVVAGTVAFALWPAFVLGAIVLSRASLDGSNALLGELYLQERIATATAVCGALALLIARRRLPARAATVPLLLLVALGAVSVLYAPDPEEAARTWLRLAALLVLFCVAAWVVRTRRDLGRLVAGVLIAAVVPVAVGLWQLVTGNGSDRPDFSELAVFGTFLHPGGFSFFLVIVVPLAAVTAMEARSTWARAGSAALLAGATVCLITTYGRSAWIAAVVVLGLIAVLEYRRLIPVVAMAAVVAALALPSGVGVVEERFQDLTIGTSANSLTWRFETWERMLPYALDEPLTGHGLGGFGQLTFFEYGRNNPALDALTDDEEQTGLAAHNDFLKMAVELGIPGLLLWSATLVFLAAAAWRARMVPSIRPFAVTAFAITCGLVVVSTVDNVQAYTGVSFYLMVLLGGVVGAATAAGTRERVSAGRSGSRSAGP